MDNKNHTARRLAAGVWEDTDGAVHFSVPELLAHLKVADTPENRTMLNDTICKLLREHWPAANIVETD